MAIKKSELYSSLWASCDELRGGMDASQYKDYILTLLFMKYVSDKYAGKPNALIEVPKGGGFADMVALKGDKEIGDKINKIIGRLAEANDLKGVIDQADFNDESKVGAGKEMQDTLSKLVAIFDGLDFRANRAEGDDLLGDAYEYLMRHFATQSGKSKGQFYTPAEVSRIMAQVIGLDRASELDQPTVYDPTCGSGSLLIKAADAANTAKLAIYGQEMDVATWALARMNMILHGHPTAELWRGNTLASPHFKNKDNRLKTFDYAVANPPFSAKAWLSGLNPSEDEFKRFEYGIPPAKNGDYAFAQLAPGEYFIAAGHVPCNLNILSNCTTLPTGEFYLPDIILRNIRIGLNNTVVWVALVEPPEFSVQILDVFLSPSQLTPRTI